VSLPEVPLLGVLPGTGGLTRMTDKRRVRHDHADIFCTTAEGVRGPARARLEAGGRDREARRVRGNGARAAIEARAAGRSARGAHAVALAPVERVTSADMIRYQHVEVIIDRAARTATWTVRGPSEMGEVPADKLDAAWWPLAMARELDDAILTMRTNELDIGTWILKTSGDPATLMACDAFMERHADHGFVREVIGMLRRTFARLEVSSRTLYALVEPRSCFAGTLAELAFAADRTYMLALDDAARAPKIALSPMNFGAYPMVNGQSRLGRRFSGDAQAIDAAAVGSARRWTRAPPSKPASSPPLPTTSTGPTRSASRWRSARRCRRMPSRAWRRTCASADRRRCTRASSGA
jgi:benzoyl-CoA-dihydrodiol lyase